MADRKQLRKLTESVDAWNTWREKNPGIGVNLEHFQC
jgi:hypothetical protein